MTSSLESLESFLVLGGVADDFQFFFLFRVFFLKELLLELFDVLAYLLEHTSDLKFIIWQVVNENSLFLSKGRSVLFVSSTSCTVSSLSSLLVLGHLLG